jgi:hypothetical protein
LRPSGCRHEVPRDNLTNNVHFHIWRLTSPPKQVNHENIHHISLPLEDIGFCLMRYKSRIVVSVISIFEAFEFVASIIAFDYVTFDWTLYSLHCFTLVVDIAP